MLDKPKTYQSTNGCFENKGFRGNLDLRLKAAGKATAR